MFEELIVVVRRNRTGYLTAHVKQQSAEGMVYGRNFLVGKRWYQFNHECETKIRWLLNGKARKVMIEHE